MATLRGNAMLHRPLIVLLACIPLLVTACGSNSSENGPSGGSDSGNNGIPSLSNGTFTLSGAVSGSVACSQAVATWVPSADLTGINLGGASDEVGVIVAFNVHFDGKPAAATYTYGDPGISGTATIAKGAYLWSTDFETTGSYTVTITSLGEPQKNYLDNLDYPVHGTAHASIPPGGSVSGMIELDARF